MFQQTVNLNQAPGQPGDFASTNRRHSTLSVPGGFVAGPNGLTIGTFAWADTATGTILSNTGIGAPTCFIHRAMQGLITTYLGNNSYFIPAGMGVGEMFNSGDFFVRNAGTGPTTIMMKAYANLTTGAVSFGAAGATVAGSIETKWYAMTINLPGEIVKMSDTPLG